MVNIPYMEHMGMLGLPMRIFAELIRDICLNHKTKNYSNLKTMVSSRNYLLVFDGKTPWFPICFPVEQSIH